MIKNKKIISTLIFSSLLLQVAPVTCSASQTLTTRSLQLTKVQVDKEINNLKTSIKTIKKLKAIAAIVAVGTTAMAGISLVLASVLGVGIIFVTGGTGMGPVVSLGIGIAASGIIATATIPAQILAIFGIGSAASIITSIVGARQLDNIEKQNPGTLTEEQKTVVAQFKNLAKGNVLKGIIKGIKIKQSLETATTLALQENPQLIQIIGGDSIQNASKNAYKLIKKYINQKRELKNLTAVFNHYEQKKEVYKKTKRETSAWLPKFHIANTKLIALNTNLKYLVVKMGKKKTENTIQKIETQYPTLKSNIDRFVQMFIQQSEKIITELEKPIF